MHAGNKLLEFLLWLPGITQIDSAIDKEVGFCGFPLSSALRCTAVVSCMVINQ